MRAPGRTRTDTGRILSPLSLPLDYGGAMKALDYTLIGWLSVKRFVEVGLVLGGYPRQIPLEIN